jgi:YggT family protein
MRVVVFLIETVFQWLVGAALLRAWMNGLRVNMRVQPGLFVMALTDWIVKPLRRWLPQSLVKARLDWGSLLAAVLLSIVCALALRAFSGSFSGMLPGIGWAAGWPALALVFLLRTGLQMLSLLLLGSVLVSWLQPGSSLHAMLARLVAPLLEPVRRAVPLLGGIDLSPAILLLLLQMAVMLLG